MPKYKPDSRIRQQDKLDLCAEQILLNKTCHRKLILKIMIVFDIRMIIS